jgi:molybdopterin molybdotransferase
VSIKQAAQTRDAMTPNLPLTNAAPADALAMMLAQIATVGKARIALADAIGFTLAEDIVATRDQPPFPASAMDGYAVRAADCPANLVLVGESAAGAGFTGDLQPGQCVRIFTGAPVPAGADTIIIQEDATTNNEHVAVPVTPAGKHIRLCGNDFTMGTTLLKSGSKLDPINLALIAATGRDTIICARKPVVSILSGGDEIVSPGETPGVFQIFDSITIGLASLLQVWGAEVRMLTPARDSIEALHQGFQAAFSGADLVVTVGGASVGDRDLMKPALGGFSPNLIIDRIAVRPGKPTWFAATDHCPVLGLPGNPASALVCAHLFLMPIIARFLGQSLETRKRVAKLAATLPANGPREHYLRAVSHTDGSGQTHVTPLEDQDSALLSVFQAANALICCPPNRAAQSAGDLVSYLSLRRSDSVN